MNIKYSFRFLIVVLVLFCSSCRKEPISQRGKSVYKIGDQKEWSALRIDESDWKKDIEIKGAEVFWIRTKVEITETTIPLETYAIQFNSLGAYEVFWDGVLVGKNGNPGQEKDKELSGVMWAHFSIPNKLLQKGIHQLAVRKSLYYEPEETFMAFWIKDYNHILTFPLIHAAFMHIFAGAFLIAALYFFFLFLGNKKEYPILIFSISCFLFFALIMMEFVRTYVPIHYSQHHLRLEIIGFLLFTIAILVPIYFSIQFPFPKRKLLLALYTIFLTYVFTRAHDHYDFTAINMAVTMWFFCIAIVLWGVYNKNKGALIVLLSILVCALIYKYAYFDTSLFAGFGVILLGMFYILAIKAKEQRIAYENSLVQSTRLRLELLKKNIQPHFLMNSLTSLIDWVEESPKKGVLFIEALAKEFDLLNQIENKTLIPIRQEIDLCRTHLEIMKYRKEVDYIWQEEGINANDEIPPAILHTLIENGITHCIPLENNSITFKLSYEATKKYNLYTLLTYAKVRNSTKTIVDGTGSKYIKARLTESYTDKWEYLSKAVTEGWINEIKIYH